ncbi:MAG: helix-turn-helix domain-containing protein [Solirubrobacterales bacterium]
MNRTRTIELTRAISHPARRRVLRTLQAEIRPCSLSELAQSSGLSVRRVDYHLRVLQQCKATKSIEGQVAPRSPAARYQSEVSEDRWVRARLAATEAEDEAFRPGAASSR